MCTMQIVCLTSTWGHRLTLIIWLTFLMDIFGKGESTADVGIYCPGSFQADQISSITCRINRTSISNAGCSFLPNYVDFTFTSSGSPLPECSYAYPPTSCAPNSTGLCFCAELIGDIYIYQYNFNGDISKRGGNFLCEICENPSNPIIRESQNCTSIQIETPTTTKPITTATTVPTTVIESTASEVTTVSESTTMKENSTLGNSTCPDSHIICDKWKIIIIVILSILFIAAVIIVVIVCKWKRLLCFENKTVDPTRSSNEHHQNDQKSGRQNVSLVSGPPPKNGTLQKSENPDGSSASAHPDQNSLKKSKSTDSEKTGSQHVASEKSETKM